jgi:hypothetical protein
MLKEVQSEIKNKEAAKLTGQYDLLKERGLKLKGIRKSSKIAWETLVSDDWSDLFIRHDNKMAECYVYFHVDPSAHIIHMDGLSFHKPFYVGMGKGNRAWTLNRSVAHREMVAKAESEGFTRRHMVSIFAKDLTEAQARELESKLILFFGLRVLSKKGCALSRMKRCLVNAQYEPIPKIYDKLR